MKRVNSEDFRITTGTTLMQFYLVNLTQQQIAANQLTRPTIDFARMASAVQTSLRKTYESLRKKC